jgi:surfeit locus 1 family protein
LTTYRRLTFRPPLWGTLLLLGSCSLFIGAGLWQLDRRQEKQALFAAFEAGATLAPVAGPVSDETAATLRYRSLSLSGHYDAAHQILLDSMVRNGRPGYQVLTPLRTAAGNVLVNRGWIEAPPERGELPQLDVTATPREVAGRLDRLPRPGLRLGEGLPADEAPWPRRLLFPTADEIASQLGYPVYGYQLLLDPGAPDGFLRDWRPRLSSPDTHLGYAVQWFAFAVAATVIYLALNAKLRHRDGHD